MTRLLLLVCALFTLPLATACHKPRTGTVVGQSPTFPDHSILLASAFELPIVRAAIISSLAERHFTAESESDGSIIAQIQNRGASLRVHIGYGTQQIIISHMESTGMGLARDGSSPMYRTWMTNLESSIRRQLQRAGMPIAPVATIAGVPTAAATPQPAVGLPPTVALFEAPQNNNQNAVTAIQSALRDHNWVIEATNGSDVVARLQHGNTRVRIQINFSSTQANIFYLDSLNLDISNGHSDEYERWMRILVDAIREKTR